MPADSVRKQLEYLRIIINFEVKKEFSELRDVLWLIHYLEDVLQVLIDKFLESFLSH